MKSKITIEVDFNNGNKPVIQIVAKNSDDIRDNLIRAFYQSLGGSSWCKIQFVQHVMDETMATGTGGGFIEGYKRIFITPISEGEELGKEAEIMAEQHRVNEGYQRLNKIHVS